MSGNPNEVETLREERAYELIEATTAVHGMRPSKHVRQANSDWCEPGLPTQSCGFTFTASNLGSSPSPSYPLVYKGVRVHQLVDLCDSSRPVTQQGGRTADRGSEPLDGVRALVGRPVHCLPFDGPIRGETEVTTIPHTT